MNRRKLLIGAAALAGSASLGTKAAFAQDAYPSKPIRLVVPFPPGGPTDVFGRRYGERLSALLGQPVVIENKAGAASTLASN